MFWCLFGIQASGCVGMGCGELWIGSYEVERLNIRIRSTNGLTISSSPGEEKLIKEIEFLVFFDVC